MIETSLGTLHCTLAEDKTPMTIANFVGLATGQKPWVDPKSGKTMKNKPYYDGLISDPVLHCTASRRFTGWRQLESMGLMSRGGWM